MENWDNSSDAEELSTLGTDPFLSAVSFWEISVKHGLGKLPLPQPPAQFIPAQREQHLIAPLALDQAAVAQLGGLPALHRDPFDRMLVCQAQAHGLTLPSCRSAGLRPALSLRTAARVKPFIGFGRRWTVHGLSRLKIGAPPAPPRRRRRKQNRRHDCPQRRGSIVQCLGFLGGAPVCNRLWMFRPGEAGCKPALRPALLMPAPPKKSNAKPPSLQPPKSRRADPFLLSDFCFPILKFKRMAFGQRKKPPRFPAAAQKHCSRLGTDALTERRFVTGFGCSDPAKPAASRRSGARCRGLLCCD
jgi:PIN domain nuclease of toxin-antitoxin system